MEDIKVRSEEYGTSKQAHVKVGKQTAERTTSKFLSAPETTTNNQEVKRSLYRLQNVNNLPKNYIRMCLTCRSLAELFNFIGLV